MSSQSRSIQRIFENRASAGVLLARQLQLVSKKNSILFALPRGGVPVGYEVAARLGVPLEVVVVRKIGAPFNPEFGIGAIAEDGSYWIDPESAEIVGASATDIDRIVQEEFAEVNRRVERYRRGRAFPDILGKTAIVVDDGLATGVTARVACHFLKSRGAKKVILAAPVCAAGTAEEFRRSGTADEVVCIEKPHLFQAVGQFYRDFSPVSDEEVVSWLAKARSEPPERESTFREKFEQEFSIREGSLSLPAHIYIPPLAHGLVLFAHGSGSSRLSPRNQRVAQAFRNAGLGTLLFDLLTEDESLDREHVFDIPRLAERLLLATRWIQNQKPGGVLPLGYFGASTGAAAALWAAAELKQEVAAVVSRGGRPDLAISRLSEVTAPTLLIVGGNDESVIAMNQEALRFLSKAHLILIPRATHLFEEPGTLEQVSREAISWFRHHFRRTENREAA